MKISLGLVLVFAGLVLGTLVWRTSREAPTAIPSVSPTQATETTSNATPAIEAPAIAAISETLPPAPTREIVSANATPASTPQTSAITLLRVHLLAKEDRAPQSGERLSIQEGVDFDSGSSIYVHGQRGRVGECPSTDAEGWAEFEVEPGLTHSIRCLDLGDSFEKHDVAPLTQGEQRQMEILVPTQDDVVLFGALVDADSSKPVSDGTLQIEGDRTGSTTYSSRSEQPVWKYESVLPDGPPVQADSAGRFQLAGKSWKRRFVNATAPGYARTAFPLALGHSDAADPLTIRMWRAATLTATVTDASGSPMVNARVDLSTSAYHLAQETPLLDFYSSPDPHWAGQTDALGSTSLVGLPPNVPLKLVTWKRGGTPREEPEALIFKAGEHRTIEISWGSGGIVQGLLTDGSGRPIPDQRIWRLANDESRTTAVLLKRYEEPAATTQTDAAGQFRFTDVPVGSWRIGISPEKPSSDRTLSLPAYAEPVEVKRPGEVLEMVLRVDANLFLRGRVIDPGGAPTRGCVVWGLRENSGMHVHMEPDGEGAFELGPLPSGSWVLEADHSNSGHAPSVPVRVLAGSDGIVLQLRAGASIAGHVVQVGADEAKGFRLSLARLDSEGMRWSGNRTFTDEFEFSGLLPGKYFLSARDRAGSIGTSPVLQVAAGQALKGIEIACVPGGQLRLRYEGKANYASYRIMAGGLPINFNTLGKGENELETVPLGTLEVRWTERETDVAKTQVITLSVGELQELVWDGTP